MADRSTPARRSPRGVPGVALVVDVVLFTPRKRELAVLLANGSGSAGSGVSTRARSRERIGLPSDMLRVDESLDDAASRIARVALGGAPSMLHQAGAQGGARRQTDGTQVTVTYFGLVPSTGLETRADGSWATLSELSALNARQRGEIDLALDAMRTLVDQQPIAFRLLPPAFTLSELQSVYELLLGRRLHKASFRRSLHASALVEATDEWRNEGRGRPAQLFRFAPPRRRRQRRGVRFDLL